MLLRLSIQDRHELGSRTDENTFGLSVRYPQMGATEPERFVFATAPISNPLLQRRRNGGGAGQAVADGAPRLAVGDGFDEDLVDARRVGGVERVV